MPTHDELMRLAERCEERADAMLKHYCETGERTSSWDGKDRIDSACKLLACAAALKARKGLSDEE